MGLAPSHLAESAEKVLIGKGEEPDNVFVHFAEKSLMEHRQSSLKVACQF